MSNKISKSLVLWLTGLSGAGKTTLGTRVYDRLKSQHKNWVLLDGDSFREVLGDDLGHDQADRLKNAYRIARMCAYLSHQEINVVCCTMSLYPEIWRWNRVNIPGYFEIYIKADKQELIRRDPKKLYKRALDGEEENIIGIHLPFEEPSEPDLIIENSQSSAESIENKTLEILAATKSLRGDASL